jgi:hypothetical protein
VIAGIVGRLAMRLVAVTSDDRSKACSPMTTRGQRDQLVAINCW